MTEPDTLTIDALKRPYLVWYIPQIPMAPFTVETDTVAEASRLLDTLCNFSAFEAENGIKPNYSDLGGVSQWSEEEQQWLEYDPNDEGPCACCEGGPICAEADDDAPRTAVEMVIEILDALNRVHYPIPVYAPVSVCANTKKRHVRNNHFELNGELLCAATPTDEYTCASCRDDDGAAEKYPCATAREVNLAIL